MSFEPTAASFDLAVIGGGITGAGVARDAALRGLSCLLLEKGDFSAGTSAKTTRLIHGGLRYLESGDLALVAESLRERETLLRMAPHLIRPMPILLPVYLRDHRALWKIRAGLWLYDLLSLGKGTPHYRMLGRREVLRRAPTLNPEGLNGAGLFYDYQILLPERLVLENIFSAREHGAYCLNYHEVTGISEEGDRFRLDVRDSLDNSEHRFTARVVVNAGGPWADEVGARYRSDLAPKVRPTKGVHVVVDADLDHAVFTSSPRDERLFFSLPLQGTTLVGTTDTFWKGSPEGAVPDPEDVAYLLDGLRKLLPGRNFQPSDVLWGYAGLRPLALTHKKGSPSSLSRRHVLHREGPEGRFLTLVGGKYTTFRKMAEDAVDAACRVLHFPVPSCTEQVPLFGGGLTDAVIFRENVCECTQKIPNLPREVVEHLVTLYGRRCCDVIDVGLERPEWREPLARGYRDYRAQVAYAVRREDAHHLDDVLLRRLRTAVSLDLGLSAAPEAARIMGEELGWDEGTRKQELERFREILKREMALGSAGLGQRRAAHAV
ncbi:MAG: glycerol-3-phosphate dehydrogenase/oxidase [Deferrisomatales bacterium]|nr:glycerol-3-phosphate dehydrogenase/oxidase [Deferrisomatales bacterium]